MEALLVNCSGAFSQHGNLFTMFFLGGVTGSITHCLAMCGPVIACQSACNGGCKNRMSQSSQWQYHFGRLITYGLLGFFAALLSRQFMTGSYWPEISAAMMVMAGGIFLLSSLLPNSHKFLSYAPSNGFLRGVLMSFMPCGLIYAALMMAATLTNPLAGMFAMWLFVLGTIPALLVASGSATILVAKWQKIIHRIGRLGMAFNGLAMLMLAAKTMR